jgi:predicted LPLAT superfamily acyltransferase
VTPVWLQQKERGVYFAYRTLIWLALQLGRTFARILIFPVCAYFIAFSSKTTKGSRLYLRRALGRPPSLRDVFRHHRCFAATILDRIYLLTDQYQLFNIRMHGDEELIKRVVHRQG